MPFGINVRKPHIAEEIDIEVCKEMQYGLTPKRERASVPALALA